MSASKDLNGALSWSSGAPTAPFPESFAFSAAPNRETASANLSDEFMALGYHSSLTVWKRVALKRRAGRHQGRKPMDGGTGPGVAAEPSSSPGGGQIPSGGPGLCRPIPGQSRNASLPTLCNSRNTARRLASEPSTCRSRAQMPMTAAPVIAFTAATWTGATNSVASEI